MPEKINAKIYTHSDKIDSIETFEEFFPDHSDVARGNAASVGYEITFDGYWTEDGEFYATSVNGTDLVTPISL
jgi:hypothetical protein